MKWSGGRIDEGYEVVSSRHGRSGRSSLAIHAGQMPSCDPGRHQPATDHGLYDASNQVFI